MIIDYIMMISLYALLRSSEALRYLPGRQREWLTAFQVPIKRNNHPIQVNNTNPLVE